MSIKVFERLKKMMMETTREERLEIDEEIEKRTGKYCDEGVDDLSDTEFIEIVNKVKRKKKKKKSGEKKDNSEGDKKEVDKEEKDGAEDEEVEEGTEEKKEIEVVA